MTRAWCLGAAGLISVVIAGGAGCGDDSTRVADGAPTINERLGTYRGVGIGSRRAAAVRRFGKVRVDLEGYDPLTPLNEGPKNGIAPSPDTPPDVKSLALWRFKHVVIAADQRDRPWLIGVTARDAWTTRGVGIGSSLEEVQRAYPNASCETFNEGTEYYAFPYCTARVAPGRFIWFGEDPVRGITMSRAPLR